MPRNPALVITAPSGQDATSDLASLPPSRARQINNAVTDRPGTLLGQVRVTDCLTGNLLACDAVIWHSGTKNVYDLVLAAASGNLYYGCWSTLTSNWINFAESGGSYLAPYPPTFANPFGDLDFPLATLVSEVFTPLVSVRGCQCDYPPFTVTSGIQITRYGAGNFISASGASTNWFFGGAEIFGVEILPPEPLVSGFFVRLGLPAPQSPGDFAAIGPVAVPAGEAGIASGYYDYTYAMTYTDIFGNESEAGYAVAELTSDPDSPYAIQVTAVYPPAAVANMYGVAGANVYRNTQANPGTFYFVGSLSLQFPVTSTLIDGIPDSALTLAVQFAPHPGQNTISNPASFGVVYQNRLVLNDLTIPNGAQISNLGAFSNFASVATVPATATDGIRPTFGSNLEDAVTGFAVYGTTLIIFTRWTIWLFTGDNSTNFYWSQLNVSHGAISTDSVVTCGNVVVYLSDDGVYMLTGNFTISRLGDTDLDALIDYYRATAAGQALLSQARAWYDGRHYGLQIGVDRFVWDFVTNGWTQGGWGVNYGLGLTQGITFGVQVIP